MHCVKSVIGQWPCTQVHSDLTVDSCVNISRLFQNLTKEQADYCISRMKPYVDKTGRAIPDAYDYVDFTRQLFVN